MSNTVSMKQGDSFAINWTWAPGDTGTTNLIGATVTCAIKVCRDVIPVPVVIAPDGLTFTSIYAGSTRDWPVGTWPFDFYFVFPGGGTHSETFRAQVRESIA